MWWFKNISKSNFQKEELPGVGELQRRLIVSFFIPARKSVIDDESYASEFLKITERDQQYNCKLRERWNPAPETDAEVFENLASQLMKNVYKQNEGLQ